MKKLEIQLDKDSYVEGEDGIATLTFINTPDGWFGRVLKEVRAFTCDIYGSENTNITVKERRIIQSDPPSGSDRQLPGSDRQLPGSDRQLPGSDRQLPGSDRQMPSSPQVQIVSVNYGEQNLFLHIDLIIKLT